MDLGRLASVASSLLHAKSHQEVAGALLRDGLPGTGADSVLLCLAEPGAGALRLLGFAGYDAAVAAALGSLSLDDVRAVSRAARTGEPVWEPAVPPSVWAAVPVDLPGHGRMVLAARFRGDRRLPAGERELLAALAGQAALAVVGLRRPGTSPESLADELAGARRELTESTLLRDQEQRVMAALQQVVLPADLPRSPLVSLAAAYQSADVPARVGGDWYDAFELPGEQLVIAVGDVSGHDLASAAAMGQLRNSLRGYALEGHRPAAVLTRLNQLMRAYSPDLLASAIYGHLDTRTALFTWASAGHPPPVVVSPAGSRTLQPPAGVLLGAQSGPYFATAHLTLGGAQTLLLYTDGLVERRDRGLEEGIDRLLSVAGEAPATDLDAFLSAVIDRMTAGARLSDDVCVLALRVVTTGGAGAWPDGPQR